jgi:hypothetical protein
MSSGAEAGLNAMIQLRVVNCQKSCDGNLGSAVQNHQAKTAFPTWAATQRKTRNNCQGMLREHEPREQNVSLSATFEVKHHAAKARSRFHPKQRS